VTAQQDAWPALPLAEWQDTYATLHMWLQIAGKIRTRLSPPVNHWWHSTLYVTARGLTTSPIPHGTRTFELTFDFLDQRLLVPVSDGAGASLALRPRSVASFYRELMDTLGSLGLDVAIWPVPQEVPDPIPFDQDERHTAYDAAAAARFWRALVQVDRVFKQFRGRFLGKSSPVHFFWGAADLAVTRFSGRPAPPRADPVQREAYSHEVISAGFWPGQPGVSDAMVYAYAAPEPAGLREAPVEPAAASYDTGLGEFVLPYAEVGAAADPDRFLLGFLQSTYEAAADRAGWDRAALERLS
jgi:Family of unknown function (DUF5996)